MNNEENQNFKPEIIQEKKMELTEWLSSPHELGRKPSKVEFVRCIKDEDETICYIFKFRTELLDPWKLGVVSESGTFSDMQPYCEETATEDTLQIVGMLKDYWKRMAATLEPLSKEDL